MKQVIFGLLGTAMLIYTVISGLSVYSISSRRNEMENCIASVLKQNMDEYYVRYVPMWVLETGEEADDEETDDGEMEDGGEAGEEELWKIVYVPERKCSDAQVEAYVKQDIIARLCSDSRVTVSVFSCDMEQGILSVGVTETFYLPNGMTKTLQCSKTLVVESGGGHEEAGME